MLDELLSKQAGILHAMMVLTQSACSAGVQNADDPASNPSPGGRLKKRARIETEAGNGLEDMEDEPQVVSHLLSQGWGNGEVFVTQLTLWKECNHWGVHAHLRATKIATARQCAECSSFCRIWV